MNEKAIQDALFIDRGRQNLLMCPNFTPLDWWECDVWMVTKAGFAVEFEIKLSLADFRADATKERQFSVDRGKLQVPRFEWLKEKKHDLLAARDRRGPSRFFFVVPHDLPITPEMVPEWAGLLRKNKGYWRFCEEKKAPKLHRQEVDVEVIKQCRAVFFWRYWHLRTRLKTDDSTQVIAPIESEVAV